MSRQVLFATLLPLVHSLALPALDSRDQVQNDVIRYMKCGKLTTVKPDVGGWELGMAGWYEDAGQTGAPNSRATFEMYTAMEDYFYNGKGSVYGADYEGGGGSLWVDFSAPYPQPNPEKGVFVGTAKRRTGSETFTYNCFTERWSEAFEYEDEKYGSCASYATCVQKDALRIFAKGTEDTTKAQDTNLPAPADIYSKFSERYDADSGICDISPIDIGTGCSVKFECKNNDRPEVMDVLIDNLQNFGKSGAFKEETETYSPPCNPSAGGCPGPQEYLYRTMPKTTQLAARGVPPPDSGRFGYEVAYIKTTVTCEDTNSDKALCDAFGSIFSLVGLIEPLAPLAEFGGIATEIGCGLAGVDD